MSNDIERPVKVAQVAGLGSSGGGETYLRGLASFADRTKTELVFVFTEKSSFENEMRAKGFNCIFTPVKSLLDPAAVFRLAKAFRRIQPDIIQTHGVRIGFYARIAAKLAGVPHVISTVHVSLENYRISPLRKKLYMTAERLTSGLASRVICVTDYLKKDYARYAGFPEERISVIYNGVDTGRFCPSAERRAAFRKDLGLDKDFLVGCAGRLAEEKRYEDVLDAIAVLSKQGRKNIRLVFAGDGPLDSYLRQKADASGMAGMVRFLGRRTDMPEVLSGLDALVLSSDSEGMPYVLLEAMSCGCPVVATSVGDIPLITENGRCAMLVPARAPDKIAGALARLMDDSKAAGVMTAAAREKVVKDFSIKRTVETTERLYRELISGQ
ncbi:MAG: glycosyltransferase [bacterium]